jgi:hypothetical protein
MVNSTTISAHRHGLRLSFDYTQNLLNDGLSIHEASTSICLLDDPRGSNHERNKNFTACTPSKSINPFLLKAGQHVRQNSHTLIVLRKDLWLQYEMTHPLAYFSSPFSFVTSTKSFTEHNRYALDVIAGDEEMNRRYDADFSYGLLGTRDNPPHQACQWVRIVHMVSGDGYWQGRLPGW